MKTLISFLFAMAVAVGGLGVTSNSAMALTLLFGPADAGDVGSPATNLIGVENLNVNGTLYNVSFVGNPPCNTIFNECGAAGVPFAFTTSAEAEAAANALLDQVFLNGGSGNLDTLPQLTKGCEQATECEVFIPYAVVGTQVQMWVAENDELVADTAFAALTTTFNDPDNQRTWAVFSVVPIPPALLLFLSGLVAFFGVARAGRREAKAEA